MQYLLIFVIAAVLYAISLSIYLGCNQGMARNARGQQSRRLLFATLLAISPIAFYILTTQPLNVSTSPLDPQGRFRSLSEKELGEALSHLGPYFLQTILLTTPV